MMAGITRQALRRHRWAFLGAVTTQCVAATVITTMLTTGTSLHLARLRPADRAAVVAADVPEAVGVFTGIAIYLAILLVGITMNAAIAHQRRDLALLRAVGAVPGQIRRSVAVQAVAVSVPAAATGFLLGQLTGWGWVSALVAHGIVPPAVRFEPNLAVLPAVLGIAVGTAVVGGLAAAIRPARVRPSTALTEAATGRPRAGWFRTGLGLVLVAAGAALSAVLSNLAPEQAENAGFFVMLAMCVGVGLLGPVLLRAAVALGRPLFRLAGGTGEIAADTLRASSRALSGALVPLVLAVAFAGVKVAAHTTAAHAGAGGDRAADVWLDYSGTAVYCAFAAIAALTTLLTVALGRARDLAVIRLAGATRRRLLGVVVCEAVLVLVVALVLATVVAGTTLVPLVHTALHTWLPYLPAAYVVLGVLATGAVVAAGTVAPAWVLTRRPAIDGVR